MSSKAAIRRATLEDVPEILALIKELAVFEECPDRVKATEETLRQTLSFPPSEGLPEGRTGYAKTFLLTTPSASGEAVAGFALYFNNYSTWLAAPGIYLEDLFVRPQYRRYGFASMLLKRLAQEAYELQGGNSRLEWSCLKWNQGALDFYAKIGGQRMDEWVGIRVDGDRLGRLAGAL